MSLPVTFVYKKAIFTKQNTLLKYTEENLGENNMSFSSLSIADNRAINNLSKYVIGAEINRQEEPSGIGAGVALMGGISGGIWLYKNRKDIKGGFKTLASNAAKQKAIVNSVKKYPPKAIFSGVRNKWAGATEYVSKGKLETLSAQFAKKPEYASLKKYIDGALKSGKDYAQTLKDVEKLQAVQKLGAYNAKVATQMANGSKFRALKNTLGITKLSKATKELAVKSGKFRGLLKGIKGNLGFAAISFGIGVISDVIPAFQLGADKGFKQLGKTTVKTGAEVAGWALGSAAGAKAGAAIGTLVGGPVGTVVGGLIGLAGGFIGSYIASKAADTVVGPSEVELAQQENSDTIAQTAKADINTLDAVAQQSYAQLMEHAQAGQLSEDDKIAKQSLEHLLGREIDLETESQAYAQSMQQQNQNAEASQLAQTPQQVESSESQQLAQATPQPEQTAQQPTQTQQESSNNTASAAITPTVNMPTTNIPTFNPYSMGLGTTMPNAYSNDMLYQNLFGMTPNPYLMGYNTPMFNSYQTTPDSGQYFKYTG